MVEIPCLKELSCCIRFGVSKLLDRRTSTKKSNSDNNNNNNNNT